MRWIVTHPRVSFLLFALVVVFPVTWISHLEIDSSAEGLMVQGDPERTYYERMREKFGSDTLTVIVIKNPNGDVFTGGTLSLIEELTKRINSLSGVTSVHSLTTAKRVDRSGVFARVEKLITQIPPSLDELKRIRTEVLADDALVGNLVSADGQIAGINVYTENRQNDHEFNRMISARIDEVIGESNQEHEVYQIGSPLVKVAFSSCIEKDHKTLIPLSVATLFVILLLVFRNSVAVLVPLLTGGFSIAITLGLMSILGYPINVVTVFVPSILIAVGCTEDVHMLCKFFRERRAGKSRKAAVLEMVKKTALPISLTAITTAIGFATLSVNKITILKQFGIIASLALLINFVITIIIVPVVLMLFRADRVPDRLNRPRSEKRKYMDPFLDGLVRINFKHRRGIAWLTVLLLSFALIGCFRIQVNTDFISYFEEDSVIRDRVRRIHEDLSGGLTFSIMVDAANKDRILEPGVYKQIVQLQNYVRDLGIFDKVLSVTDYLVAMDQGESPRSAQGMLGYDFMRGLHRHLKSFVDESYSTANIVIKHNITSSKQLSLALAKIRGYIERHFPENLGIRFTGEGLLINNAADAMVKGQIYSLGIALIAIFLIMSVLFSSFRVGLLAMIPNTIPIVLNFGVMGWLGIPLNTGTCMVAAIALGVAVDNTIHFTVRYRNELKKSHDHTIALPNTLRAEGEPIFFTSLALFLGFAVLMLSNFNPTKAFGLLAALVMAFALLTDLFINPIICRYYQFGRQAKCALPLWPQREPVYAFGKVSSRRPTGGQAPLQYPKPFEPAANQTSH